MNKYEKNEEVFLIPVLKIAMESEIMLSQAMDDWRWELCEKLLRFRGLLEKIVRLFRKFGFNPDQPRVPAGNPDGGQWTDGGGGGYSYGDSVVEASPRLRTMPASHLINDEDNKFNVNRAINRIYSHADELRRDLISRGLPSLYGDKRCAEYVRDALNVAGLDVKPPKNSTYAKDYGPSLKEAGFYEFMSGNKIPPLKSLLQSGDVAVIQATSRNKRGHMQMYTGYQWVSDFRQHDFWPGPYYRSETPEYIIYRYK